MMGPGGRPFSKGVMFFFTTCYRLFSGRDPNYSNHLPGPPKECVLEVLSYIKPTKKHPFGGAGVFPVYFRISHGSVLSFAAELPHLPGGSNGADRL